MTSLADFLTAEDCRRANLNFLNDSRFEYDTRYANNPFEKSPEQRIRNVKDSKIRRNLEAVDFRPETLHRAWSHNMAVWAGTHLWPDANHRTAHSIFNLAAAEAYGVILEISLHVSYQMVSESKRIRRGVRRFFTVDELASPTHPYRLFYASYEPALVVRRV